jgi:hypothetical protein
VVSARATLRRAAVSAVPLVALLLGVLFLIHTSGGSGSAGARPPARSVAPAGTAGAPPATTPPSAGTPTTAPPVTASAVPRTRSSPSGDTEDEADGSSGGAQLSAAALSIPQKGDGTVSVIRVPGPASTAKGRVVRYTVELEGGLGADAGQVARTVRGVLLDDRGWQRRDHVRFVNVSPAQAARGDRVDIRVTLASPALTDRLCLPLRTLSQVSCWNGTRSVLNLRRWMLGDDSYGKDVAGYRVYQVNHEVGHGLGHSHQSCPGTGRRAPIMVQQTLSLQGCAPWPYPAGA